MDLNNRHTDYIATMDARAVGRDLYAGSSAVKARGTTYLYQGKNESDEDYAVRKQRAVFDPYVEKIINARQALLFRKQHTRNIAGPASAYIDNVDRKGTPADVFFQRVARDAQVDGAHWVAVDMTALPDGGYVSEAAERAAGHRPFFEAIPADNVLDWSVGDDLMLDWAVISTARQTARAFGEPQETVPQWKVWTRNTWHVFEHDDDGQYAQVAEGVNTCGRVPLVPFLGNKYSNYAGVPVCTPIFDHVLAVYNKTSDMDWFEYLSAHPIPYMIAPKKPEKMDVLKGIWLESLPNGAPITVGYLEPTGAGFNSHRESIRDVQARLYAIALAQAQKDTAQVQSAAGQREDRHIFTSSLASISRQYESSEKGCWNLAALWLKRPAEHEIHYSRDFDDSTIEAAIIGALASMVEMEVLTRKTVLKSLVDGELVDVEDIEVELEEARKESEQRSAVRGATADLLARYSDDEAARAG
jgi:hypothetical protein